ncbi:hypothetical protein M8494_15180 [Serratia ureilytica]
MRQNLWLKPSRWKTSQVDAAGQSCASGKKRQWQKQRLRQPPWKPLRSKSPGANRRRTCACGCSAAGTRKAVQDVLYKHIATAAPMTRRLRRRLRAGRTQHSDWQRPSFNFEGKGLAGGFIRR